jgi:hypothetical protein
MCPVLHIAVLNVCRASHFVLPATCACTIIDYNLSTPLYNDLRTHPFGF